MKTRTLLEFTACFLVGVLLSVLILFGGEVAYRLSGGS